MVNLGGLTPNHCSELAREEEEDRGHQPWERDVIESDFPKVRTAISLESHGGRDSRNRTCNQMIKVRYLILGHRRNPIKNPVEGLVIDEVGCVALNYEMGYREYGVVDLHAQPVVLGRREDGESGYVSFGVLVVQRVHQQGGQSGARTARDGVDDLETLKAVRVCNANDRLVTTPRTASQDVITFGLSPRHVQNPLLQLHTLRQVGLGPVAAGSAVSVDVVILPENRGIRRRLNGFHRFLVQVYHDRPGDVSHAWRGKEEEHYRERN